MDLFSTEKTIFKLPNAELVYIPNFYTSKQAANYFKILEETIAWQQDSIKLFGKTHQQPRLTALYATINKTYSYSNIKMIPNKLTPELAQIQADVEQEAQTNFTTVLLNLYRNGQDSNGWHADNEKELGKNPIITSVSFGETRFFHFKHRQLPSEKYKIPLENGSLLIMSGDMQQYWLHQIAKTKRCVGKRINLTFRKLI